MAQSNVDNVVGDTDLKGPARLCVGCRKMKPRDELLRLTVDYRTGAVILNNERQRATGRSAYLCLREDCVTKAQKGSRLRQALEGRKRRQKGVSKKAVASVNQENARTVRWPLEPQLIKAITDLCNRTR